MVNNKTVGFRDTPEDSEVTFAALEKSEVERNVSTTAARSSIEVAWQ